PAVAPPPPVPEAPRDLAALPPDPAGAVPPPPSTEAPPPPDFIEPPPAEQAAPSPQPDPPAQQAAPSPPPEPRPPQQQATAPPTQAQADPLPLPPPPPPEPPQRAAAASPPSRPAQPAAPQGPVRLDAGAGDMAAPSLGSFALGAVVPPSSDAGVRNNPPDYPEDARRRGQEGVVRLALRVNAEGLVTNAAVEESSGVPSLDRAAMEAARRWRFRPAMRAGMPVAATLTTAVHFRLSDSRGR
ncbi:energy transducer TonB, partial [Neoroseomonas terrae]